MDNRVEGERGWGCSSEGIFEVSFFLFPSPRVVGWSQRIDTNVSIGQMFSLPGFMPTKR